MAFRRRILHEEHLKMRLNVLEPAGAWSLGTWNGRCSDDVYSAGICSGEIVRMAVAELF
jgi:hypothetical protein